MAGIPLSNTVINAAFDITYDCNLRCIHCFNSSGEQEYDKPMLSDDEIFRISSEIAEIKSLQQICFCGGEPLLKKDVLFKSADYLHRQTNSMMVNFVTNAFLMDDNIIADIKKSRIYMVQVSLDGYSENVHNWIRNHPQSYERAISAIKLLIGNDIKVSVATLPTKRNFQELSELIGLLDDLGVSDFRMQPLMILGRAKSNLDEYELSNAEYRTLARKLLKLRNERLFSNKMKIEWGDPIQHLGNFCGNNLVFLYINAYGEIMLSPYLPIVVGDLRKHSLRDYFASGLKDIWKEQFFIDIAKQIMSCGSMDLSERGIAPEIFTSSRYIYDICESESIGSGR
ncbi:MAG: radical SAM protein [Lachnospiraceae bacterium]|nr:radical SAM protein [Lachnospiraceae bacterium]